MSLAVLLGVLGQDSVVELIEEDALGFLRVRGSVAYIGNGGGIQAYGIYSRGNHARPFCAPMDEALKWAIQGISAKIDHALLLQKVIPASQELDLGTITEENPS